MKRHFLVLLFALTSSLLVAQKDKCTKIIHGRILELGTETPVAFALVKIEGTSTGATSDENGEFTLKNVCPDEIHLEITHVSYRSISHHHDAYH
ncbi:MAG: carboxypeptidase-like regulatory domain-containing protein, partial [Cyclobacteriaceae bacterium]